MANYVSATAREHTPHATRISDALKRRAQAVLNDTTIDPESRAIIRYAMEVNDPWLAKLVRQADAGETIIDGDGFLQTLAPDDDDASDERIEALAELICRAGDDPATTSAALFVLMAMLENAAHPKALANAAKHFAFTCCGELNLCGMIDAQVAVLEHKLFAGNTLESRCS